MCDPPEDCLLEFSKFGAVYPSVFWPVVDCEEEKIDLAKLQSMIAPPIERIFKESYEEGKPFMEYRIVVEEDTTPQDIDYAFRAIKATADIKNRGGRKRMDKLVALQCVIYYDDHNSVDPEDNRCKLWTYEKLAAHFKHLGVKNKRSAEEHIKYGRELRKANNKN